MAHPKSPTALSMNRLEDGGWLAQVVEHWIPYTQRRRDLFNMGDILAVRDRETLLIQATSRSNVSARVKKIQSNPQHLLLKHAGWTLVVWGWDYHEKQPRLREVVI